MSVVSFLFQSPYVYLANQKILVGDFSALIKELRDIKPDETVLDIACGVSLFAPYIKGRYTGVDNNKNYIKYDRQKYPDNKYLCEDFRDINFEEKSFDVSVISNFLHHLQDSDLTQLLDRVNNITKKRVIIADVEPNNKNPLAKFLYSIDQGKFMRTREGLENLIDKSLKVDKTYGFFSPRKIYKHAIFVCSPR